MKIETKYEVGEHVWFKPWRGLNGVYQDGEVIKVIISIKKDHASTLYVVKPSKGRKHEAKFDFELFRTRDEIVDYWRKNEQVDCYTR